MSPMFCATMAEVLVGLQDPCLPRVTPGLNLIGGV